MWRSTKNHEMGTGCWSESNDQGGEQSNQWVRENRMVGLRLSGGSSRERKTKKNGKRKNKAKAWR